MLRAIRGRDNVGAIRGRDNVGADCLSRNPLEEDDDEATVCKLAGVEFNAPLDTV